MSYHYLNVNDSKLTQQEMRDDSKGIQNYIIR